jgi:hypothetical protein
MAIPHGHAGGCPLERAGCMSIGAVGLALEAKFEVEEQSCV